MRQTIPLALLFFFISCCSTAQEQVVPESTDTIPPAKITLLFVGDLMQHKAQLDAARTDKGTYLYAIKEAGFNVLLTANNHCLDRGKKGLERTILMLDSLRIPYTGTYRNEEKRRQRYPLLIHKNGFRIALLNYTYDTNGVKPSSPNIVNYIDKKIISIQHEHGNLMLSLLVCIGETNTNRYLVANNDSWLIGYWNRALPISSVAILMLYNRWNYVPIALPEHNTL